MRLLDRPSDALLAYAYHPNEAVWFDLAEPLVNERRLEVLTEERTGEELEALVGAALLEAAQTSIRPEDAYDYFGWRDLGFSPGQQGAVLAVGDVLLALTEPEYVGAVVRQGDRSGVAVYNPQGVVRIDPDAPDIVLPPIAFEPRQWRRPKPPFDARAMRRAKSLLFRHLRREQKWELRAHNRITTVGQDGRTYRIYGWQGGNVKVVENGVETTTLCVVPNPQVTKIPVHDLILAHKILLENAVDDFLGTARAWAV